MAGRLLAADVVNDKAKAARVKVEGTLGGKPFWVERTQKRGGGGKLAFWLDGEDLSQQARRGCGMPGRAVRSIRAVRTARTVRAAPVLSMSGHAELCRLDQWR